MTCERLSCFKRAVSCRRSLPLTSRACQALVRGRHRRDVTSQELIGDEERSKHNQKHMCCERIFQVHCLRAYNTKYILITRHYYKEIGRICDFRGEVRETVREMQWVTARVSRRTQHRSIESHPKIVRIKPVFWWAVFSLHKRVFSCRVNMDRYVLTETDKELQSLRRLNKGCARSFILIYVFTDLAAIILGIISVFVLMNAWRCHHCFSAFVIIAVITGKS